MLSRSSRMPSWSPTNCSCTLLRAEHCSVSSGSKDVSRFPGQFAARSIQIRTGCLKSLRYSTTVSVQALFLASSVAIVDNSDLVPSCHLLA